jgi:hypothetical protein
LKAYSRVTPASWFLLLGIKNCYFSLGFWNLFLPRFWRCVVLTIGGTFHSTPAQLATKKFENKFVSFGKIVTFFLEKIFKHFSQLNIYLSNDDFWTLSLVSVLPTAFLMKIFFLKIVKHIFLIYVLFIYSYYDFKQCFVFKENFTKLLNVKKFQHSAV